MNRDVDVLIVGGGLAGACAAALLARHGGLAADRIGLLSDEPPHAPIAGSAPELRVVAISRASERILRAAGAWALLDPTRLCAYERMRVWHESTALQGEEVLCFDAADVGEPNLGYIVENSALLAACVESFRAAGGVSFDASATALRVSDAQACVQCSDGSSLKASLVVGADGAQSLMRAHAGLTVRRQDYRQRAIVAVVRTEQAHQHTAWQRFLRTGPLALLPLFDGASSVVWSLDEGAVASLIDCSAGEFEQRLAAASDFALGAMQLQGARVSFALHSMSAEHYVAPRCALIGDAAHVIHPLAGQGANLGLLDAAALCETIAAGRAQREDLGAMRLLRGYEQRRRTHNLLTDTAMSLFQRGFGEARGPASWLLNRGFALVNRSGFAKRLFAQQALGLRGELPRFARLS